MEILDKKIKFNPQRVYRLIAKEVGVHLNALSEPCAEIHTKLFQFKLYRELGVDEKFVRNAAKQNANEAGTKGKGSTYRVPFTFILGYLYYRFAKANKEKMAEDILIYFMIKAYGGSYHKFLPNFCNPDVFRYTMENVVKVHLFLKHKTIASALVFLTKHIHKKFYTKIKNSEWNPELMIRFMHDGKDRVNQSTRSFMNAYHRNIVDGKSIGSEKEAPSDDDKNMFQTTTADTGKTAAIERFLKSMYVYKNYDRKAIEEAKTISRVKNNLAEGIITIIHNKSSQDNVKIILTSFLKEILDTSSLCGPNFFKIVKKFMMVRNYKDSFLFRNLIVVFTNSMFESIYSTSGKTSQRDKISLELFVALYITISFRNLFC